jgi:sugar/nucleoside kinase (ribokinase family)
MAERFDLVAVGDALVDVIAPCEPGFLAAEGLLLDGWTRIEAERALALQARMTEGVMVPGGSGANTACGVSALGGRAGFVGKVGDDALGLVFADALAAAGVAYATPPAKRAATGRSLINVTPDGLRSMATCIGAAAELALADLDAGWVARTRMVKLEAYLFQTPAGHALAEHAAELARSAGGKVALSLSSTSVVGLKREALLDFVDRLADVVLGDVEEVEALLGAPAEAALASASAGRTLAVTLGAQGSLVAANGETVRLPAWPVERVVDTTGAGDQYAAGLLFGLARGLPPARAGELGSRCAAEVITQPGPRPQRSLRSLSLAFGVGPGDEA